MLLRPGLCPGPHWGRSQSQRSSNLPTGLGRHFPAQMWGRIRPKLIMRWDTRTWREVSSYMITYLPMNYDTPVLLGYFLTNAHLLHISSLNSQKYIPTCFRSDFEKNEVKVWLTITDKLHTVTGKNRNLYSLWVSLKPQCLQFCHVKYHFLCKIMLFDGRLVETVKHTHKGTSFTNRQWQCAPIKSTKALLM